MKYQNILNQMTLEEKAALLSGKTVWKSRAIKRLGIPSFFCSDGPHGLRKQDGEGDHLGLNASLPATCFPTAATVANSWDIKLAEEIGVALGREALEQGVNVLLGPGLNIKRSPLCGRNFEYFSEDPYLAGKMAAAYIRGIQSQGVYACPKHFAVNSQEERRMAMNAVLDERTLREIYLTGFEIAVKEGNAKAIMTSYNEINGIYANENPHLLSDILREEWGFDGIVITDWGASNDHAAGVAAGSDLEMPAPGLDSARELIEAVRSGKIEEKKIDMCADRIINAAFELNKAKEKKKFNREKHHELARKAAAESAVLLKNEGHILPLKKGARVALIGDFAILPRYQGAGSSMVNPTKLDTMEQIVEEYGIYIVGIGRGYDRQGDCNESLKAAAIEFAKSADVVIYCFGLDELSESEGLDRIYMKIPGNQIELLSELAKVNKNIVGVISAGSAIEMPFEEQCMGILHGYLYGQAGAKAMMDLLTGKENPSGKLNETYPIVYEDTPAYYYYPARERNSEYRESIFVGYRYYDTRNIKVRYPFGYGLSYTSFQYSNLEINPLGVTFLLKNIGTTDGAEISQLYLSLPESEIFRPKIELKGFAKTFLKAGESKKVSITFDDKSFRYWNEYTNGWEEERGNYLIQVGSNAGDMKLTGWWKREGTTEELPYRRAELPSYFEGRITKVSDPEYEALLGRKIPAGEWKGELGINDAICQMYYAKSRLARLTYHLLRIIKERSEKKGKPDLNILFIYNMPFRALAKMTGGMISMGMAEGIVMLVNGHFLKGAGQMIREFLSNISKNRKYEKNLVREEQK